MSQRIGNHGGRPSLPCTDFMQVKSPAPLLCGLRLLVHEDRSSSQGFTAVPTRLRQEEVIQSPLEESCLLLSTNTREELALTLEENPAELLGTAQASRESFRPHIVERKNSNRSIARNPARQLGEAQQQQPLPAFFVRSFPVETQKI